MSLILYFNIVLILHFICDIRALISKCESVSQQMFFAHKVNSSIVVMRNAGGK